MMSLLWVVIHMTLAALRKKKGLTQEELAAQLGVSTSAVGNWEAGLRRPRYETLRRLAEVLGVPLDDLSFPTRFEKINKRRVKSRAKQRHVTESGSTT